jgi:hypothetical protein
MANIDYVKLSIYGGGALFVIAIITFVINFLKQKKIDKQKNEFAQQNYPQQFQQGFQQPQGYQQPQGFGMAYKQPTEQDYQYNTQQPYQPPMQKMGIPTAQFQGGVIKDYPQQQSQFITGKDLEKPLTLVTEMIENLVKSVNDINFNQHKLSLELASLKEKPTQSMPSVLKELEEQGKKSEKRQGVQILDDNTMPIELPTGTKQILSTASFKLAVPDTADDNATQIIRENVDKILQRNLKALKKELKKEQFETEIEYAIE